MRDTRLFHARQVHDVGPDVRRNNTHEGAGFLLGLVVELTNKLPGRRVIVELDRSLAVHTFICRVLYVCVIPLE
jgi:hypothetical protein